VDRESYLKFARKRSVSQLGHASIDTSGLPGSSTKTKARVYRSLLNIRYSSCENLSSALDATDSSHKQSVCDGPRRARERVREMSLKPPLKKSCSSHSVLQTGGGRKSEKETELTQKESLDAQSIAKKIFREKLGIIPRQAILEEKADGSRQEANSDAEEEGHYRVEHRRISGRILTPTRVLSVGEYRSPESPEEEEAPCARQSGGPDEDLYGPDVHHRQSNGGSHTRKEPCVDSDISSDSDSEGGGGAAGRMQGGGDAQQGVEEPVKVHKKMEKRDTADSGISSEGGSICGTLSCEDTEGTGDVKITKNISQIEALIKRINDENKKTKEVLEKIDRGEFKKGCEEGRAARHVASFKDKDEEEEGGEEEGECSSESVGRSRVSYSGSWATDKAEDVLWASAMESKRYPIVAFNPAALSQPSQSPVGNKYHLTFKVVQADAKIVSQIFHAHGFHEVGNMNQDFNLMWTGSHPKPQSFKSLLPHQRVNHFPRSYELTRKDRMYKNIERLQHAKGPKHFNFIPKTFLIPHEYSEFAATHHRMRGAWIVKPVASSRGRGIFLVNHPNQVPLEEPMVVAKYIDNPLLINGHKSDLRLYVLVTSYDPLIIYLYEEGLVRFATVKYDNSGKNLWNPCMHLCNYSINKYHSDYIKSSDPDNDDQGHKWSLSAFLKHLKANNIDTTTLMQSIEDVIIKSIISVEFPVNSACKMFVPHRNNCFELYGFDILVDSELKAWLIEVNLSPSLNVDTPVDMKIKSAMISDLMTLVGIPAVDPVLKRAQFNQKINSMTQDESNKRFSKRNVSSDTRRYAAIRLASGTSSLSQDLSRMIRDAKEQQLRRRGWVRIFPTAETWNSYGALLEYSSSNNLLLHEHLFPDVMMKPANRVRSKFKAGYEAVRKRSQSAGGKIDKKERAKEELLRRAEEEEGEGDDRKPTPIEQRIAQYEKPLTKGHRTQLREKKEKDPEKLAKRKTEKRERSQVLKEKMVKMIESGLQLSEYQARKAFAVYLHCILQRLSDFDPENGDQNQIDLVLKFLQKAALSLRESYMLKPPSTKLSGKDKAAVVAKDLGDFLTHYKKETEMFTIFREEAGMIPRHIFEEFIAFASDSDLEDVLTLQTKLYRCAHIFLGKCLPPVTSRRNPLLRTAYGISPDRNLRDRQCSMRMSARSNPPISPMFALPPPGPAKCLDIQTTSGLEVEAEIAEEKGKGKIADGVYLREGYPRVASAPTQA